jgi:peroxiredoxin
MRGAAVATSTMLPLGTPAPDFELEEVTDGDPVSLSDLEGADVLVVAFLSRHCPYVKHVQGALADLARDYTDRGVAFVGIASNDPDDYPDDAPGSLAEQKREAGFPFPYLFDATQEVAKAYRAACTPDFFVFDGARQLVYRGRMGPGRPDGPAATGEELREVLDTLIAGAPLTIDQKPSMGCSIKWRRGNEPEWVG